MSRRAPDPLTIAYLALGAGDAWAEANEDQRVATSDSHNGHLGYICEVIGHALVLDILADGRDLPGVFVYEVAEPFGKLDGAALLHDTPRPEPLAFVEAWLAQNIVEHGR